MKKITIPFKILIAILLIKDKTYSYVHTFT